MIWATMTISYFPQYDFRWKSIKKFWNKTFLWLIITYFSSNTKIFIEVCNYCLNTQWNQRTTFKRSLMDKRPSIKRQRKFFLNTKYSMTWEISAFIFFIQLNISFCDIRIDAIDTNQFKDVSLENAMFVYCKKM